ncbi:hypothetical protein BCR32DRAFT_291347 [Anaeromyces robustus]|uniref:Uncharacterized protein n=1 Tax=Anaeromyces robustus TaxID=1754192 RepID=A0A1Y1XF58_9FUNG|nr:hypothetical protein BCR32DRAFT_291347 [Anaeromyces robustus]|eukprot:ORX84363.1 hypothetical protein BCR32DRAFT_291347 [Anaeromyces robustus]
MKIAKFIQCLIFLLTIVKCKVADKTAEEMLDEINGKPKFNKCKIDTDCTDVPFEMLFVDVAKCNSTSHSCTNYCFVNKDCKENSDCNYSLGDRGKCGAECYKQSANDTIGQCYIIAYENQICGYSYVKCAEGLECDIYFNRCLSKDAINNQSGEPLFSLFLFMLIMLSLFNRQRADEDLLNNMGPNELLMVTLPSSRRRQQEEDTLPVYRPIDDESNDDELIEQNIPELNHPDENQQNGNDDQVIMMGDEDDLPLLPPSYDEAISGYVEDDNNNNSNSNVNVNDNGNTNSSS